ncbi:MAG: hypothetical protein EZS28_007515, partial [Streblomastix strix]
GLCKVDGCNYISETTPIEDCPCPTDPTQLDKDPRKDGLCKVDACNYISETTPIEDCPCPTDPTQLDKDPRKDGLCKVDGCNYISETTPIEECPCPTDPTQLDKDPRKDGLCKSPPTEIPTIDVLSPTITDEKDVEIDSDDIDQEAGAVINAIQNELKYEDDIILKLPNNQIYEETKIQIGNNQQIIIRSKSSEGSQSQLETVTVIQPLQDSIDGVIIQPETPLIIVSINGDLQIEGFTISHFAEQTQQPLISSEDESVLRLINVILTTNQYTKKEEIITVQNIKQTEIQSPFIYTTGKQLILTDVKTDQATFNDCSAIILNGSNGVNSHSAVVTGSKFVGIERSVGSGSAIGSIGFTMVFTHSSFTESNSNTYKRNEIISKTCEWTTSAVRIEDSIAWFDSTSFTNLENGALSIGAGAKVTLTNSAQLYGNKPSGISGNQQNARRNIICAGTPSNTAQLRADNISFLVDESGAESGNKWILAQRDTCELFGAIQNTIHPLFAPIISELKAQQIKEGNGGISIDIKGASLIGCGMIWIQVSEINSTLNTELKSITYRVEKIATQWDDDLHITAIVPEDNDVVQKGKKLQIKILVGQSEDAAIQALNEYDEIFEAVDIGLSELTDQQPEIQVDQPDVKSSGTSLKIILIIAGSVLAVIIIVVICICVFFCYWRSHKKVKQNEQEVAQSSKGIDVPTQVRTEHTHKKHHHNHAKKEQPQTVEPQQQPKPFELQQQPKPVELQQQPKTVELQQQPKTIELQEQPKPVEQQEQPQTHHTHHHHHKKDKHKNKKDKKVEMIESNSW